MEEIKMADISGYLNNIRSAESGETVRDSIIQCLNKINNDNPNKTKPLNVTANGTYTSETGYSYNPVTVNVPAGGSSNYTFEELEVTENGEYEPEEDNTMYKKVTVNVPQLANDLAPDGYTITQNGEYDPLLDGYDGYGKIIVNVNEATGDGPFTVQFYDKVVTDPTAKVINTQTVNKNGNADFGGPAYPVDPSGKPFVGWNPNPINVTRDLKCYPVFSEHQMMPGEISDSWETICAKAGAGYPIGSYKDLYFSATFTVAELAAVGATGYSTDQTITFEVEAIKVAEGENNTISTWITTPSTLSFDYNKWSIDKNADRQLDWEHCNFRKWLQLLHTKFSPIFLQCIKPVYKYSQNSIATQPPYSILTTQDYLWVPSVKEMCIDTDYWHHDLDKVFYQDAMTYEQLRAKYYEGVPLAMPYFNTIGIKPVQRDEWFFMGVGQTFSEYNIGLFRDRVSIFNDRHASFPAAVFNTYTDPDTGDEVSARYVADSNNGHYGNNDPTHHIFGFCMG